MHDLDEDGFHDPEECEVCVEQNHSVSCDRRCGKCCELMLIEATLRDAEREPQIAAESSPLFWDFSGVRERIGYLLNDSKNAYACRFLDRQTQLCTIYETRPLVCRVFHCERHGNGIHVEQGAERSDETRGEN